MVNVSQQLPWELLQLGLLLHPSLKSQSRALTSPNSAIGGSSLSRRDMPKNPNSFWLLTLKILECEDKERHFPHTLELTAHGKVSQNGPSVRY